MKNPKKTLTSRQYDQALEEIEAFMGRSEDLSESELARYRSLVEQVEEYESIHFPIDPPDPVEAIRFRMEQEGLRPKDLIPYIGDKTRVSRVLAGKLDLSKTMIQRLHQGLGIPLESLLGIPVQGKSESSKDDFDWGKFPVKEMVKRKWIAIDNPQGLIKDAYESVMRHAFPGIQSDLFVPSRPRVTKATEQKPDPYARKSWELKLMQMASAEKLPGKYNSDIITADFRRDLARLSYFDKGPVLAKEFLNKNGIHLIILEHLPKTYLDGAALMLHSGEPVIGLTLRHNRLDNFWFNLFHELAHIRLHLSTDREQVFLENLERQSDEPEEREADRWALDSLIPDEIWRAVSFDASTTRAEIIKFAASLRIHPSVPAGRIRYEQKNFTIHSDLLGRNALVRADFHESYILTN